MDRTSEFLSLAQSLPPTTTTAAARTPLGGPSSTTAASSAAASSSSSATDALRNFHSTAAEISRDIASTSALLQELAQRVQHRSVFDDDSAHINYLVVRIKSGIENLNARLDQAASTIAQQKRRHGKNSQASQEASNLVDGLKSEFAEAASGFKKVLQQRTDNLKETEDLQRQVYGGGGGGAFGNSDDHDPIPNMSSILSAPPPVYHSAPPSLSLTGIGPNATNASMMAPFPTLDLTSGLMPAGEPTSSSGPALPRPHGVNAPGGGGGGDALGGMRNRRPTTGAGSGDMAYYARQHSAPLTPLDIQRMEEESGASQLMQLIPDQDYLRQRADAMSTVESNIVELGTIFNKLAVMVSEHRELVQRVEDNVEDANANVNLSLAALTDTLTSLRTNRMLALRVFSILVAFIIFFIVFFA